MIMSWLAKILSWLAKMVSWLANVASPAFFSLTRTHREDNISEPNGDEDEDEEEEYHDPLMWSCMHARHSCGEYSFAVCQANDELEDFSQVDNGTNAIFVGIYDSHGGPIAAQFVTTNLFNQLMRFAKIHNTISELTLAGAVASTENEFLDRVRMEHPFKPYLACTGTCCLVGVIYKGTLLIANLGDSRAVLGYMNHANKITAEQLTEDHNVNREQIRRQLSDTHTDDPNLVFYRDGAYRVKGILQVSKSIGDLYMKYSEFQVDPSLEEFQLPVPIRSQPAISSDPDMYSRVLQPHDQFLIFASDELWNHLTNQEAVEIVYKYPPKGIAKRLIKAAQKVAARKANFPYEELHTVGKGFRREIHDDITVVVVFIDHESLGTKTPMQESSIKGFSNVVGPSNFEYIDDLM